MKISQKKIAEHAGVSYATVSRVFTKNANVTAETVRKVEKAMRELGLAPSLDHQPFGQCGSSGQVLVVAGDVADDFYSTIIKGICDRMHQLGLMVVLCNSRYQPEVESQYIWHAQQQDFAGVILVTAVETAGFVDLLKSIRIPVVLVNRYIRSMDLDVVCIDNVRGGYMAASYLIKNGHRRIALLLGPQNSTANQDRLRGFSEAMQDAGLSLWEKDIVRGDQTRESGRAFGEMVTAANPPYTALFISNNPMAVGAANRLRELGYHIPQDISIVCFDNSPLVEESGLRLTTVSYDAYPMGIAAADTMQKRIEAPYANRMKLIFAPQITPRSSVRTVAP